MRKQEDEDDRKMTGRLGSMTMAPALKRNVSEIKMHGGKMFMGNDNASGQVGGLVRKFKAMMTSRDNLKEMSEVRMTEMRFETTYKSPGKMRKMCRQDL